MNIIMMIVMAGAVFIGGAGYSLVTGYRDQSAEITRLRHDATLSEQRVASYKRMIDRRDAAIDASTCKARIRYLVTHPDEIPAKFEPFNPKTGN